MTAARHEGHFSSAAGRLARGLPVLVALLWLGWSGSAEARIYKYVDRDGDAHYTDSLQQVPMQYRYQVRDISPEMEENANFRIVEGLNGDAAADGGGFEPELDADFGDLEGLDADAGMVAGVLENFGFGIVLLFLLAIPVLYVVSALIFKLACRIGGEDPPGLGRACGILLAQGFAGSAVGGVVGGIAGVMGIDEAASIGASIAVGGASTLLSWMVNAAILASMMSYGFVKSMWIGFLHTLLVIVMIGGPIGLLGFVVYLLS